VVNALRQIMNISQDNNPYIPRESDPGALKEITIFRLMFAKFWMKHKIIESVNETNTWKKKQKELLCL
jgi:hypothetical protein